VTFSAQAPRVEHGAAAGAGEEAAFAPAADPVPAPVPVDAQEAAAAAVVRAQIVWIQLSVLIKLAVICFLCTANREMSTMRLTIIIGNGFILAFFYVTSNFKNLLCCGFAGMAVLSYLFQIGALSYLVGTLLRYLVSLVNLCTVYV
jgi:hypothetical protein